ncbi:MAG: hypothetical protein J0H10_12185 [Alphaproteobacteria bacterium]|nr:hypothetical protein [Alphaproteobacteria bacterium]
MGIVVKDILHVATSDPALRWSRVNAAEQFPGVMSTLTWDIWRQTASRAGRNIFFAMGLLRRAELADEYLQFTSAWHGRQAANVDAMRAIIGRLPGDAANSFEEQILGARSSQPGKDRTRKRTFAVLLKMPVAMLTCRRALLRDAAGIADWHRHWIARIEAEGDVAGRAAIAELIERLPGIQTRMGLAAFVQQALSGALQAMLPPEKRSLLLAASAAGLPETRFADAVWALANGRCSREQVIAEFGHFGIDSADCAKPSLRHKPDMLDDLVRLYRGGPRPGAVQEAARARRLASSDALLSHVAWFRRPLARWLLRACDRMAVLREVGRGGWVQALDIGRAGAFAIGNAFVRGGRLEHAEDAFHLTVEELLHPGTRDLDAIAAYRKALHAWRDSFDLPVAFTGEPEILPRHSHDSATRKAGAGPLQGMPGSAGCARGRARVVHDPFHAGNFARGDILVCRITDPNWAPLMALAGGVVTDIGGALSHGAIIAREMGIPAVLNTGDGTLRIPDGAEIAIDGATGAIRILDDGIDIHARSVLNDDPGTAYWSRVNYAEAMPGVASPLGASIWRRNMLEAPYRVFARMGVLPSNVEKARRGIAGEAGGFFYGRAAVNVDFIRMIGDRTPGTSGAATEEGFLGGARPGLVTRKRYGRYPVAIAHLVWLLMTMPREVARIAAEADAWWRRATRELADADAQTARFWLSHAADRFFDLSVSHGVVTMLSPAVWGAVAALARRYGDHDILLRLSGGYPAVEEVEMSARLFQVADGTLPLAAFLDAYGFRGPNEGEVSSRSWREDPAPLTGLLAAQRARPTASQSSAATVRSTRLDAERTLLSRMPFALRPFARFAFALADRIVPLRETSKAACLGKPIDVCRAAARRLGHHLAAQGIVADAEDVFFLTLDDLANPSQNDWKSLVAQRRALHQAYRQLDVAETFQGAPAVQAQQDQQHLSVETLSGVGVSAGVVTGPCRVVTDPADTAAVAAGEIIVCHITDPAWTPILSLAGGMIVDIGGILSHAAVIARELGVPCIVNTRIGSKALRTGMVVRMDGTQGTVTVLAGALLPGAVTQK